MADSDDMFGEKSLAAKRPVRKWLLVTNQRNLFYMLAAGLVMPPSGFGKKYYQDTLISSPGWIALFPDRAPKAAVEFSVQERSHLMPCLLEMDLSLIQGRINAISTDGSVQELDFPEGLSGDEQVLLLPAPVPVTLIKAILFRSKDEKASCEADANDFGNVPLSAFNRRLGVKPFGGGDEGWKAVQAGDFPTREVSLKKCDAAGAVMAMLSHYGNLGQQSVEVVRMAYGPDVAEDMVVIDPMIAGLASWMWSDSHYAPQDVLPRLFWGTVDDLVEWKSSGSSSSPLDVILDYLADARSGLDERMGNALGKLSDDLRKLAGVTDSTVTELFERHPKPFSRVMTLFFLRESCAELLEFKHPLLTEADYLAAAILFGVRDGWIGLPVELRDLPGLSEAIPPRMAAQAHLQQGSSIRFVSIPKRPKPVRELMQPSTQGWNKAQREVALLLAREGKWPGVQTRITLGKGDYRLEVDGRGMHLVLDGEAKAVQTEIDPEVFFRELASQSLSRKQEVKVRGVLKA